MCSENVCVPPSPQNSAYSEDVGMYIELYSHRLFHAAGNWAWSDPLLIVRNHFFINKTKQNLASQTKCPWTSTFPMKRTEILFKGPVSKWVCRVPFSYNNKKTFRSQKSTCRVIFLNGAIFLNTTAYTKLYNTECTPRLVCLTVLVTHKGMNFCFTK